MGPKYRRAPFLILLMELWYWKRLTSIHSLYFRAHLLSPHLYHLPQPIQIQHSTRMPITKFAPLFLPGHCQ